MLILSNNIFLRCAFFPLYTPIVDYLKKRPSFLRCKADDEGGLSPVVAGNVAARKTGRKVGLI